MTKQATPTVSLSRMIWNAHRLHSAGKRAEATQAYAGAAEFAHASGLGPDAVVPEAMILALDGKCEQAEANVGAALESARLALPGLAWFTRGWLTSELEHYDQAIDCYRKALDAPDFEAPGIAWNNMGNAYADKKDYLQAIESWGKAIPLLRERGDDEWAERAQARIAAAELPVGRRSRKDEAALAAPAVAAPTERGERAEDRIRAKLTKAEGTKYEMYGQRYDPNKCESDVLAILKGWGSAVSLLGEAGATCRGGGYLLKWRGKGVAIDPGFDFLNNLHDAGFHCREINAVIVSHNHTDHNDDLRTFDDIRYEMYKRAKGESEKAAWKYVLLWDADTAGQRRFDPELAEHRDPDPHIMQRHGKGWGQTSLRLPGLPFRVGHFGVKHSKDVPKAVGVRIECLNEDGTAAATVGFTCDTGFFEELCDKDHLGECDVIVAHMSEPDPEEYDDSDHLKQGHLGYRGVQRLITRCKPKLTIVGEFWAGITDLRIDLVQGLRALCRSDAILPASIGLQVRPKTLEVRCTNCRKWIGLGDVRVGSPGAEFGPLSYLCRDCRL